MIKIGSMNNPLLKIEDEIDWIGRNKFDYVEITYEYPIKVEEKIAKIKKKISNYQLGIVGHTSPDLPAIFPLEEVRSACLEELKQSITILRELGAEKIIIHPFIQAHRMKIDEIIDENFKIFAQLTKHAKKNEVSLLVENSSVEQFGNFDFFKLLEKNFPDMEYAIDLGHLNLHNNVESQLKTLFLNFEDKINHLHCHDNKGYVDEHLPIGCGTIDWQKVGEVLSQLKYDKSITIEVFADDPDYKLISRDKLLSYLKQ